jgi:hypothetical protein
MVRIILLTPAVSISAMVFSNGIGKDFSHRVTAKEYPILSSLRHEFKAC